MDGQLIDGDETVDVFQCRFQQGVDARDLGGGIFHFPPSSETAFRIRRMLLDKKLVELRIQSDRGKVRVTGADVPQGTGSFLFEP
jgi:hypothetical protein